MGELKQPRSSQPQLLHVSKAFKSNNAAAPEEHSQEIEKKALGLD